MPGPCWFLSYLWADTEWGPWWSWSTSLILSLKMPLSNTWFLIEHFSQVNAHAEAPAHKARRAPLLWPLLVVLQNALTSPMHVHTVPSYICMEGLASLRPTQFLAPCEEINKMAPVSRPMLSHPLTPCSVNNGFAWVCNSWDHLEHCTYASCGTRLATGYFCSGNIYKLHLEKPWMVVCSYVMSAAMAAVPARRRLSYSSSHFLPAS